MSATRNQNLVVVGVVKGLNVKEHCVAVVLSSLRTLRIRVDIDDIHGVEEALIECNAFVNEVQWI